MVCFALVFVLSISFASASEFSGDGTGTFSNPFQIENCNHLQQMKNELNSYFILMNDINCSDTKTWNSGKGFEPIGTSTTPFKGTLIGNMKNVNNLYIRIN